MTSSFPTHRFQHCPQSPLVIHTPERSGSDPHGNLGCILCGATDSERLDGSNADAVESYPTIPALQEGQHVAVEEFVHRALFVNRLNLESKTKFNTRAARASALC